MAFYKWALDEIGGFDPVFRKAGDDVDVCWRLQERGHKIGFSPASFVWHYRRSTVKAYLKQQRGYGEAEALLAAKHPEYFNTFGGGIWRGRIYTPAKFGVLLQRSVIYHGLFGSGFFQKLYAPAPAYALMFCTSLEFHVLVTIPLVLLALSFKFFIPVAIAVVLASLGICVAAALQADLPKRKRHLFSRPLVATLFFLQPIVRGWARYKTQSRLRFHPLASAAAPEPKLAGHAEPPTQFCYWSKNGADRFAFLRRILAKLDTANCQTALDSGWNDFDVELICNLWTNLSLVTVNEYLANNRIFLRCRLDAKWSGLARFLFWSMLILEIFLIGFLCRIQPWIWMILLTVPLLGWFFDDELRYQKLLLGVQVEKTADHLNLEKYRPDQPAAPSAA
jgi:hypothetical protein